MSKTVFITGGSRGIGKELVNFFKQKKEVVIAPERQELDLLSRDSVNNYLNSYKGDIPDIIILCAGINEKNLLNEVSMESLDRTFQVNLFSGIEIIKKFTAIMRKRKSGKIIFISSLYAIVSREGRLPYACAKNAINGAVKTLALELSPDNILVNAVAPGYVVTEMTDKNLSEEEKKEICRKIPTGRFQEKSEIVDIVDFLTSEKNRSITGQLIAVDGGFLCR